GHPHVEDLLDGARDLVLVRAVVDAERVLALGHQRVALLAHDGLDDHAAWVHHSASSSDSASAFSASGSAAASSAFGSSSASASSASGSSAFGSSSFSAFGSSAFAGFAAGLASASGAAPFSPRLTSAARASSTSRADCETTSERWPTMSSTPAASAGTTL